MTARLMGVVLAGGQSARFGGDKAMALWKGRSLIDHAIDYLRAHCEAVAVAGRSHGDLVRIFDRPGPDHGPLGGIAGALHAAAGEGYDALVSLPCDTPLLPPDMFERLIEIEQASFVIDCPVIGFWPAALSDQLDQFLLQHPAASMRRWTTMIGAKPVDVGPIANVNREEDLRGL